MFKKDGVVTAGNASGIVDGAAALVIAGERCGQGAWPKPLGRIVSWAAVGVEPTIMGIGPAPAIRKALERAKLALDDLDLIEINEAFAPQYLACEKELGLDRDKVNVNGGAIALGHPLGASGARLLLTLLLELRRRGKKYGVASACIGGGQGIAMIVEACVGIGLERSGIRDRSNCQVQSDRWKSYPHEDGGRAWLRWARASRRCRRRRDSARSCSK